MSSDRAKALDRARVLSAAHPGAAKLEIEDADRATLSRGRVRTALRLRPRSLPLRDHALDHLIAVGVLKAAAGDRRHEAFVEVLRALSEQGNFVYGEADQDATFGKDHHALREMGFVPAPMDTVPELFHVPWRLLVAFKPRYDPRQSD